MISPLTLTLLVVALLIESVAITTSLLLIVDARRDWTAVRRAGVANGRSIVARASVVTETLRLVALFGLVLMTASATVTFWAPDFTITPSLLGASIALDVALAAMLAQSVTVYSMRRRLFDAYRREHPPPPPAQRQ